MSTRVAISCDECGWSSSAGTQARADYAFRRHSCEKQRAHAAAAARAAAREATIDRAPKPCMHKRTTHQHGTYACYVLDRCRCRPCADANTAYERERIRQTAYGRWNPYVPAEPARTHLRALMAAGMGWKRIARAAGLSPSVVYPILYGKKVGDTHRPPVRRLRQETADRLLAVELDLADGVPIDGTGTRRRLRALVAIGYSISSLARRLGWSTANLHRLVTSDARVAAGAARLVGELYDELSMTPFTGTEQRSRISASRARNLAARNGWAPPLAWDDETLDDPDARPGGHDYDQDGELDVVAIERRMAGDRSVQLTKAERVELARRWEVSGRPLNEMQRITGVHTHRYRQAGAA